MITVSTSWMMVLPTPPAFSAIQPAATFKYGCTRTRSDSGSPAKPCHRSTRRSPRTGTFVSQAGGGGSPSFASVRTKFPTRSEFSAMVEMPIQVGTTRRVTRPAIITATAGPRRPPRRAWTAISHGQVAMTIIVAQTTAATNGSMTQRLAKVMAPMARTPRVMRGRSNDGGGGGFPASPSGVVTRHPPGAPSLRGTRPTVRPYHPTTGPGRLRYNRPHMTPRAALAIVLLFLAAPVSAQDPGPPPRRRARGRTPTSRSSTGTSPRSGFPCWASPPRTGSSGAAPGLRNSSAAPERTRSRPARARSAGW